MKTRKQQRRSGVAYVLWSVVAISTLVGATNLIDPDGDSVDRMLGIGFVIAAILFAYGAGRWREL